MTEIRDPVTAALEAMRTRPARDVWVMLGTAKRDNELLLGAFEAVREELGRWKRDSANAYAAPTECAEKLERIIGDRLLGEGAR